ncbi:MAG: short-chain dehydrogenase, partial [Clostridia bacterium]|nr:short-chain dehydrogenase [Clostridia bacterium]
NIKISSATPGNTATAIFVDTKPPETAQTPHQSASRILNGVVNNDRLILGDDSDAECAGRCFDYASRHEMDAYFLQVARTRREGKLAF